jgi:class 3 adenylate cyclase
MELLKEKIVRKNSMAPFWKTNLANYACTIRPIAAIMFTNIADFTSIMEVDEQAGLKLLSQSRKLQKYYIEQFRGARMVEMGDGILTSFNSAEDAVQCALKIQRGAKRIFNHQLRIGIHIGEVNYIENDVFGHAVNVAYDIQSVAKAGQILVSESIAKSINPETCSIGLHRIENDPNSITTFEVKPTMDSLWSQDLRLLA